MVSKYNIFCCLTLRFKFHGLSVHNIPRAKGSTANAWLELFQVTFLCNSRLTLDYFQDFALHNSTAKPTGSFWISEKDQSIVLE